MNLLPSRNSRPRMRVWRVLIPLGVVTTVFALTALRGQDNSVVPPAPAPGPAPVQPGAGPEGPASPPLAAKSELEITVFRAGPGPYAWAKPGRIASTFITDTPEVVEVVAHAKLMRRPDLAKQVEWEITPPAGFQVPEDAVLKGGKLTVRLQRKGGNPTGGGEALSLSVKAYVAYDEKTHQHALTLTQDLRDRLRQEYVDLKRATVPDRWELIDETEFRKRYGKKYPGVEFSELNWSKQPVGGEKYPFIVATESLVRTIHQTEKVYGQPLVISSGFRNPIRQVEVHAPVGESYHQYGRAADLYVAPDSSPPKSGRKIATEKDWLRLAAAAIRGGGVWIEPMLACHVNTNGCHVHVDVRENGVRSSIVQVSGKVTDPTGNPVPGATVRLAGMPAPTNAQGQYLIKHVLTPKQYDLQVEAPGRPPVTQSVQVGETGATAMVQLPADPQPTLVARVAGAERLTTGMATVRVALKNVGLSQALSVRLSASAPELPAGVTQVTPSQMSSLAPGQEALCSVQVPLQHATKPLQAGLTTLPLKLTAVFRTPKGASRAQDLPLDVALGPEPGPAAPVPPVAPVAPADTPPSREEGTLKQPKARPDLGAAAGGLAAGAAAAGLAAAARRRARKPSKPVPLPPLEPVDPATLVPRDPVAFLEEREQEGEQKEL
jgi:carboxypeptidase family protein